MRNRLLLVIIIGTFIFVLSAGNQVGIPSTSIRGHSNRFSILSYIQHSPITITSNEDFETQGWTGNGTAANPYIIERLNITSDSVCINISDTTAYFEIRDTLISSPSLSYETGIYFENVTHGSVNDCFIRLHGYGIYLNTCSNCSLINNTATSNDNFGFRVYLSSNCTIAGNIITNNGRGFKVSHSGSCFLKNNTARNSYNGFSLFSSSGCILRNNTSIENDYDGFHLEDSSDNRLTNNTAERNYIGIELQYGSTGNLLFFNHLYNNFGNNGYDDGSLNDWDNGTHGNYWSDYDGSGIYTVPGSAGSADNYPCILSLPPTIDSPPDVVYEYGTLGHSVTWSAEDADPNSYAIYRNDTEVKQGLWNSSLEIITTPVDGLSPGVYNYTAVVCDTDENSVGDMVLVSVTAEASPVIEGPSNNQYELGTEGHLITWNAYDVSPSSYEVYRNSTLLTNGSWNGDNISINIDTEFVGTFNYTLFVYDILGNNASDSVVATIVDTTSPTLGSPADIEYEVSTTGHSIDWNTYDLSPSFYEIFRNGSEFETGAWSGSNITIDIDGLDVGLYNYTLMLYDQSGNTANDTVMVTVSEELPPIIDSPADVEYELGSTDHSITWNPSDLNPGSYQVLRNGSMTESGTWNGSDISVNIDGLEIGVFNYTLIVYDGSGNNASDSVLVTVVDTTPPTIDHPADIEYELGTEGHTIEWSPTDSYPASYEIYRNGSVIESGHWDGSTIDINIDGVGLGFFDYSLVVYDTSDNNASDSVIVTVVDTTPPTIDHPADIEYELGAAGQYIRWNPFDLDPESYEWFINDTLQGSGLWLGGRISVGLETFHIETENLHAIYFYTLAVYDGSGYRASDTVKVTIVNASSVNTETSSATTDAGSPPNPDSSSDGGLTLEVLTEYWPVALIAVSAVILGFSATKGRKRWQGREIRSIIDEAEENVRLIERAGTPLDSDHLGPEDIEAMADDARESLQEAVNIAKEQDSVHFIEKAEELKSTLQTKYSEALGRFYGVTPQERDATPFGIRKEKGPAEGVKVLRGCEAIGGIFEYKVKIQNSSPYVITNVKANIVSYPEDSLEVTGDISRQVSRIEIGGFRSLLFRFVPTKDCVEGKIMANVSFLDFKDEVHSLEVRPYVIKSVCDLLKPLDAEPTQFGLMLNEMQSSKEEIVVEWNPEVLFIKAKRMLMSKNFKVISSEEETADGNYVATIHALAEGKYTEKRVAVVLVITGQQDGSQSQVMIEVKGDDISMLPTTMQELREDVQSWTCLRCGAPLSPESVSLILRGNSVKCEFCGAKVDSSSYEQKRGVDSGS